MHSTLRYCIILPAALFLGSSTLRAQHATLDSEVPRTRTLPGVEDPAFPYAEPESVGVSSERLQRLGDEVATWVANGDPVGAELLIVKDGHAVFHESYGWSDREGRRPMARESIYRIRSMTKPVVGTAVLMLVDDGLVTLDEPASRYLPSFDNDEVRSITVRELLTHTSGLGGDGVRENRMPTPRDEYESLESLVDDVATYAPLGPRGAFLYHDANAATLGALVAHVSGMPVERFIEERIFEPLGMADTHTRYTPDAPWSDRMNSTYRFSGETCDFERYWDPTMEQRFHFFRAAGGLYSTPMDYARFTALWMNKGRLGDVRLLKEETVEAALKPYGDRRDGRRYGMFWTIRNSHVTDGLPAAFGHGGSDGTVALALPELDAVVLFFTQSRSSSSRERFLYHLQQVPPFDEVVVSRWNGEIDSQWETLRTSTRDPALPLERLAEYAGAYARGKSEHEVTVDDGGLKYAIGERFIGTLRPLVTDVFLTEDPCSGTLLRVTFERGPDGSVGESLTESHTGSSAPFKRRD